MADEEEDDREMILAHFQVQVSWCEFLIEMHPF